MVGTSIASTVNGAGQFALLNVPPGQVQLRFSGAGVNAYATMSPVATGDMITITVRVVGSNAVIVLATRIKKED